MNMDKGMKRRCYASGGYVKPMGLRDQMRGRGAQLEMQMSGGAPIVAPAPAPVRTAVPSRLDAEAQRNREYQIMTGQIPAVAAPPPRKKILGLFKHGGPVPGRGNKDSVPAMLTPGEFVMTKGAVKQQGSKKLALMNKKARAKGLKRR